MSKIKLNDSHIEVVGDYVQEGFTIKDIVEKIGCTHSGLHEFMSLHLIKRTRSAPLISLPKIREYTPQIAAASLAKASNNPQRRVK